MTVRQIALGQVPWLGPRSGAALALGSVLFLGFLLRQLADKLRTTWARLVAAAGVWMVLWGGATLLLRSRVAAEGSGAYGEPERQMLMELAIFGFALNAVYGFGQKLLGWRGAAGRRGVQLLRRDARLRARAADLTTPGSGVGGCSGAMSSSPLSGSWLRTCTGLPGTSRHHTPPVTELPLPPSAHEM